MRKNNYFFIVFLLCIYPVFATPIDSILENKKNTLLQNIVESDLHHKPNLYIELVNLFLQEHNLDSAKVYVEKAIISSKKSSNNKWLIKSYYKNADILYYDSKYKGANDFYLKAQKLAIQIKDTTSYIDLLIERGYLYNYWSKKDSVLKLMHQAIDYSDRIHYLKGTARAGLVIGNMYFVNNDYTKALEYYQKTLDAAIKLKNDKGVGIAYGNIGACYLEIHQYDLAIDYLEKSIISLKNVEPDGQLSNAYNDLAIIYSRQQNKQKVLENLDYSYQIVKKYGNKEQLAVYYNVKSECLNNLHEYVKSNQYLDSCINIAKSTGYGLMLQKSYKLSAENYKKMNKYNIAYNFLIKHNQVKDSLLARKYQKQLAEFDVKYKTLEKQHKIEQLQHKEKLNKEHFRFLAIGSSSLLIIILLLGYFIIEKRRKQKEIAELDLEKSQIKTQSLIDQLELKNKQLTSHALNMMQKNQLLSAFENRIIDIYDVTTNPSIKDKLYHLKREVNNFQNTQRDWDTFKIYFEQVNNDFIKKIKIVNPELSQTDLRIATLIKLNMTNKEMASILNITHQSIKNALHRLKNKLDLSSTQDLRHFIERL